MSTEIKNITESQSLVSQELNNQILAVLSNKIEGFEKAFVTASAIMVLQKKLTPEFMNPILALQGSNLGFKTDKVYSMEEVKACLIDAVLLGLSPTNNEFNIIAKQMYPTRQGFGSLLKKINGLKYSISYSNPIFTTDKSSANCTATIKWELNGVSNIQEQEFAIKSNAYATADAILGKAERKARRWLFNTVEGTDIPDGDASEVGPYIDVTPKASVQEVAINKQHARVISHIEKESATIAELEKCSAAIRPIDADLISTYVRKHMLLSTTLEELKSCVFTPSAEDDYDLFVEYSDKLKEFKTKK
jgi:hypothetical protein